MIVVCTEVQEVMFRMNRPYMSISLEDQMGFLYNDEALGVPESN